MIGKQHLRIVALFIFFLALFSTKPITAEKLEEGQPEVQSICVHSPWSQFFWTPLCDLLEFTQKDITITFGGDVLMEYSLVHTMKEKGAAYPFEYISPAFHESDYSIINLETPITDAEVPFPKLYNFKASPILLDGLSNAGVDLVSLANNHTLDYKEQGLLDTLDALQAKGIDYIGAGRNQSEAYKEKRVEIKGKTISILAFSEVLPHISWYAGTHKPGIASGYQLERVTSIIDRVRQEADYVLVYYHWGDEKVNLPNHDQTTIAHALIDHGVDAVIGSHPHVLQGFEIYKGKPIAYSLGNFLFPNYVTGKTAETGILTLSLSEEDVFFHFAPHVIKNDQIIPLTGTKQQLQLDYLSSISFGSTLDQEGNLVLAPNTD